MPRRRRPFRRLRGALALPSVKLLDLAARALPRPLAAILVRCAASIAAVLPSRANRIIDRHRRNILAPAGLDVSPRDVYASVALGLLDFLRLSRRGDDEFLEAVRTEGAGNLERALAAGRGALCITAHYGAWELIPRAVSLLGHSVGVVGRKLSDAPVSRWMDDLRSIHGVTVLDRTRDGRRLVGLLRANAAVGILVDQDTTAVESCFADFFGLPALTPTGPFRLAARFGIPVVPLHISRVPGGSHLISIEEPIDPSGFGGENGIAEFASVLNRIIEGWIREDPSQWTWFHERWCRRPPGCPGLH